MNVILEYLRSHSEAFVKLAEVREIGWNNPNGNTHFEKQRRAADTVGYKTKRIFFNMMRQIGREMEEKTACLKLAESAPTILDVCAAPGRFVSIALDYNPRAEIYALTLPVEHGGHEFLAHHGETDNRVKVQFIDITQCGLEYGFGLEELTDTMTTHRLCPDIQCDLILCDGQLLRTHEKYRDPKLETHAAARLSCSQLILALNRVKEGGTLVMLLHKAEAKNTFQLLAAFSTFSEIQLFKPSKCHATRSSFYLVARNIDPHCAAARSTVEKWKSDWRAAALDLEPSTSSSEDIQDGEREEMEKVLETFDECFIQLTTPVWDIQRAAIERAPWFKQMASKPKLRSVRERSWRT